MQGSYRWREAISHSWFVLCAILSLALALGASKPAAAKEGERAASNLVPIDYIDADGNEASVVCWVVDSQFSWNLYQNLESVFYPYVAFDDTFSPESLTFDEHTSGIILMDDCVISTERFTINGQGGSTLTIFGQKEGTGSLEIRQEGAGEDYVAFDAFGDAAGGESAPRLEVYGGHISIETDGGVALRVSDEDGRGTLKVGGGSLDVSCGGTYGIDCGWGLEVTGGTVTAAGGVAGIRAYGPNAISGGTITAEGTGRQGAGMLLAGDTEISAGEVCATGPSAGIAQITHEGQRANQDPDMLIEGGTVTGTCTGVDDDSAPDGPGIGSLLWGVSTLTIKGGTVSGSSVDGAGIGGAEDASADGSLDITIMGGSVSGTSMTGAGIGCGQNDRSYTGSVTIYAGTVSASSNSGAGIGGGAYSDGCDVEIAYGTIEADSVTGAGIGGGFAGKGRSVRIVQGR